MKRQRQRFSKLFRPIVVPRSFQEQTTVVNIHRYVAPHISSPRGPYSMWIQAKRKMHAADSPEGNGSRVKWDKKAPPAYQLLRIAIDNATTLKNRSRPQECDHRETGRADPGYPGGNTKLRAKPRIHCNESRNIDAENHQSAQGAHRRHNGPGLVLISGVFCYSQTQLPNQSSRVVASAKCPKTRPRRNLLSP